MNYPRLQYSYFLENGAQIVVRAELMEGFEADIKTMLEKYPPGSKGMPSNRLSPEVKAKTLPTEECPICHSQAYVNEGIGKNGKPYKNRKCVKNKEHINWWDFDLDGWRGL